MKTLTYLLVFLSLPVFAQNKEEYEQELMPSKEAYMAIGEIMLGSAVLGLVTQAVVQPIKRIPRLQLEQFLHDSLSKYEKIVARPSSHIGGKLDNELTYDALLELTEGNKALANQLESVTKNPELHKKLQKNVLKVLGLSGIAVVGGAIQLHGIYKTFLALSTYRQAALASGHSSFRRIPLKQIEEENNDFADSAEKETQVAQ